ncbi:MAG: glycosyltransferase family 4 protein [Patescibacteria group bacterium]
MDDKNGKKKIILACEIYPPDIGGPATYASELREQLLLHGYMITLLSFADQSRQEKIQGGLFNINRNENVVVRSIKYALRLLTLANARSVIYGMGPVASGLTAIVVGWLQRCTVVIRVPGDRAWETHCMQEKNPESFEDFQRKAHMGWVGLLERIEHFVVRRADQVVVPSEFLKKVVQGWGAKEDKVTVIPNAVTLPVAESSPQSSSLSILAIGRLVPWKGLSDLLQAFQIVLKSNSEATLTIVGDGPERARLEKLARELNVSHQTHFSGSVSRERLSYYWQRATLFALPSGYEGFPHLVLEAWAAGVPVVVSDAPGIAAIVRNGENGLVVPYHDISALSNGITALLLDRDLRNRLSEGGRRTIRQYRWDRVTGPTIQLLLKKGASCYTVCYECKE